MPPKHIALSFLLYRKATLTLVALALLAALFFCVFFLAHSYTYLAAWFRSLNPCFYRNVYWERDFFTPAVKAHGNLVCWAGIIAVSAAGMLIFRRKKSALKSPAPIINIAIRDVLYPGILLIAGAGLWLWAHHHILPYMDEVFSAIHCADGPPFQAYAYYMLPNNHIFFNVLNNLIFHNAGDHVFTGRIISGASFLALLLLLYYWLRQLMNHRFLALLTTFAIAIHFQCWGFGAMARGYELYLLCQWSAFIFLWQYVRKGEERWLRFFSVAVFTGFATLPTFLYFYVALTATAFLAQCYRKKADLLFVRYTAIGLLLVFLFYVPSFCFSGLHAFLSNEYVQPKQISHLAFFGIAVEKIHESLIYCYTGYYTLKEDFYLALAAIPLLFFLFFWKKERLVLGTFYMLMWLSVLVIYCGMRQSAYQRNLIAQLSFTYSFMLITIFYVVQALLKKLKLKKGRIIIFPLFLALFFYHFIKIGKDKLALSVYHFDINRYGELLEMDLRDLPPKASVAFSDESFYLLYLSRKKGFYTRQCGDGNEEFYIKTDGELLPQPATGRYKLMWERGDYRIYQRK